MRVLWLIFTLHTAFAQVGFGRSYLKNSRLCHEWSCLNTKLGLSDTLPPREQYEGIIKSLLPAGAWQDTVGTALDVCYGVRSRRYTNTCPGQALMHCLVDQFIENCPEESLRKNDACTPVSSLAGLKYMFSQSLYENLEANLATERRPAWFLRNYFKSKCCRIPPFINTTVLSQCGFGSFLQYFTHEPHHDTHIVAYPRLYLAVPYTTPSVPYNQNTIRSSDYIETTPIPQTTTSGDKLNIVSLKDTTEPPKRYLADPHTTPRSPYNQNTIKSSDYTATTSISQTTASGDKLNIVSLKDTTEPPKDLTDPLDCCNMDEIIKPTWRSECDFEMTWDAQARLSVVDKPTTSTMAPSTSPKPVRERDIMILPQSCEQETCVFKKLNIVSESGSVDMEAFLKLLDNFTNTQPTWNKAKARVVTTCLTKPIKDYEADCDINKVLACTFDVLTENCPQAKKVNLCKHSKENKVCQISSSKYRPKHRRDTCYLPNIVNRDVLIECGLNSLTQVRQAAEIPVISRKKSNLQFNYSCKDQTAPTTCLMNKMGVLNKYGFMDYFKMKDRIRQFTSGFEEWKPWTEVYLGAFTSIPLYREHCSSPKKLLNVLDAMVMTCPLSKRKATPQCGKIFTEMTHSPPLNQQNATMDKLNQILNHFHHIFWPVATVNHTPAKPHYKIVKRPIYDYGILKSQNAPKVEIIDVKPVQVVQKPLVLLPVYLRPAQNQLARPSPNYGVLRNDPFALHNRIANAHLNSTISTNPTMPSKSYNPTKDDSVKLLP